MSWGSLPAGITPCDCDASGASDDRCPGVIPNEAMLARQLERAFASDTRVLATQAAVGKILVFIGLNDSFLDLLKGIMGNYSIVIF